MTVWPSLAHQVLQTRGRKRFLLLAEGHGHVRLWQAGSQSHTMDPDDSSTSQRRLGQAVCFSSQQRPLVNLDCSPTPKRERTRERETARIVSRRWKTKIFGFQVAWDKTVKHGDCCSSVGEGKTATWNYSSLERGRGVRNNWEAVWTLSN